MDQTNTAYLTGDAAILVAMGVTQLIKPLVPDSRIWPIIALVVAVAWNAAVAVIMVVPIGPLLLQGVLTGLAANGLYAGGKAVATGGPVADTSGGP
jgi:Cu/Ag efflux pump CusA